MILRFLCMASRTLLLRMYSFSSTKLRHLPKLEKRRFGRCLRTWVVNGWTRYLSEYFKHLYGSIQRKAKAIIIYLSMTDHFHFTYMRQLLLCSSDAQCPFCILANTLNTFLILSAAVVSLSYFCPSTQLATILSATSILCLAHPCGFTETRKWTTLLHWIPSRFYSCDSWIPFNSSLCPSTAVRPCHVPSAAEISVAQHLNAVFRIRTTSHICIGDVRQLDNFHHVSVACMSTTLLQAFYSMFLVDTTTRESQRSWTTLRA